MSAGQSTRAVLMTLATATQTGAGQAALNYCEALRRDGWRVAVACGPPPPEEGPASTTAMRAAGVELHVLDRVVAPTWPVWSRLRGIAREVQPAAIIGMMLRDRPVAMALSRALRVPGVIAAGNQHFFNGSLPVRTAKRLMYRFAVRRWASLIICPSQPVLLEIRRFGVAEERAVLLPNGIVVGERHPLSPQERRAARAELGAGPDDILLLNVGRLDVQKGQDILIDAFDRCAGKHRNLRLALIGEVSGGSNRAEMAEFAKDLRRRAQASHAANQIMFAGWRSDVPRLLRAADGYVHSARWEGLSLAFLEAMAAELPVVMTDCSGTPEGFVESLHGWIVPVGDSAALAEAMDRLVSLAPERRVAVGHSARILIEDRYDIRVIGARFAELVAAAIARGR